MAEVKHVSQVVGVELKLTMAEAIALVNIAKRIGQIIDVKPEVTRVDWEALCSQFLDDQGRNEAETFYSIWVDELLIEYAWE